MLELNDPKWATLQGGYRMPTEAPKLLRQLSDGEDVWDQLWEELHHQGDVDEASYAAVPHLVQICHSASLRDGNFYGLVSTIEVERFRKKNPPVPIWLGKR